MFLNTWVWDCCCAGEFEFDERPMIDERVLAEINTDRTITPLQYARYFEEFSGFTVEQMRELAERSIAWHESHAGWENVE